MEASYESESESESEAGPGTQRPGTGTVSAAVREHLRKLCLREFPCGAGSWNKSRFLPQTWRTWRELVPREEDVVSPGEETVEALLGLVRSRHSPWALLNNSNAEDSFLRELAIRNPLTITDTFFYSYFRSLRVIDKKVTLVDKDLLKFLKLEELVLSANRIKEVDATNLPPTLKVLELYGNEISSMECLCAHPPAGLQHLGLGHNKLLGPLESLYVTANHWPNLVSLDLGFNDLTDLQSMVTSLRTLRHLRLLVLQGNPLALVPYYRGLTIDSLAQLCVLDDITVSPNEKHLFRGLSLNGDLLAQEAQFVVTIGNIRGVLDTSVLDPEPRPEGPFITYNYYVTYDFVKDEEGEMNESAGVLAEIVKPSPSLELLVEESPEEVVEDVIEDIVEEVTEEVEGSLESEVEESGESELSVISGPSTILQMPRASAEELAKLRLRIDPRLCPSPGFSPGLWCYLLLTVPCLPRKERGRKTRKGRRKTGRGKERKSRPRYRALVLGRAAWPHPCFNLSHPPVLPSSQEWKVLKKKKEPPKELRQDPPILQVLGRGLVILEPLLAGEPLVSTVCNFGVVRTLTSDRLTLARDSKKIKKVAKKGLRFRKNNQLGGRERRQGVPWEVAAKSMRPDHSRATHHTEAEKWKQAQHGGSRL
ncbi:leucine-rich repeat-containing protein 43 isoform X5 [Homo sapiens]|uniref:leucine-rich repeat-containing protein 43 isoform X5 n=1 Tax=Homo sapiens TaxID=9606 RepID=UPI001FB0D2C9|nr:leucine-rich repeat-containing protein 43 isoform X5 [Homo sapiens]XP_054227637.1 leucine-rich repeat-containing protein 43 isoform X5 [Homo sapiens]